MCANDVQINSRKKFNVNAKVVLKACSEIAVVKHRWQRVSDAALLAADISPRDYEGKYAQPVVTATLLAALPPSAMQSRPYTFSVTATFADGSNNQIAYVTLQINYVRLSSVNFVCMCLLHFCVR